MNLDRQASLSHPEFPSQSLVDELGVGLALGRINDLADEPAGELLFAGAVLLHLAGVLGDDAAEDGIGGSRPSILP